MIKSSALYISVMVSLIIVLICGAILMSAALISNRHKAHKRDFRLRDNLQSGVQLVMSPGFATESSILFSLFAESGDSVRLSKVSWGIYELGSVDAWIQNDTVSRRFLMGTKPEDSTKVFYLADEDRPMSISGLSLIQGTAFLPKAGIKAAYVNGLAYNEQKLVHGPIKDSGRDLPVLNQKKLAQLKTLLDAELQVPHGMLLLRDSVVLIDADFKGKNALVVAKYIKIADYFSGQLQAIATDSIIVGSHVKLSYPSALVLIKNDTARFQTQIRLGSDTELSGQMISFEQTRTEQMPVISIGERSMVKGEIWSKGYVNFSRGSRLDGTLSAIRLMARVDGGLYENYLIDVKLSVAARSRYYLSPDIINIKPSQAKILCWIN